MAQIQVCLRTILRNEYFAVLNRVHGTGVDVDVRVKFLHGDRISSGLQKTAERSCGNTFSQSGNNSAGYKYIFNRHISPP